MESAEQLSLLGGEITEAPGSDPVPLAATGEPGQAPAAAPAVPERELAPMLQHYVTLKRRYPEHLLLFQVGDFFEIFFDDAPRAADALNIRLTSRNKEEPSPIPMCGFPIHAIDNYLPKLLQAGYSCVVISQVDDGKGKKGPVQREISRIVTPGVRYEGDGLDEKRFNYLASLCATSRGSGAIAFVDVSTGWLRVQEFETFEDLPEVIRRVRPAELLMPSMLSGLAVDRNERWFREARAAAEECGSKLVLRPYERSAREEVRVVLGERLTSLQNIDAAFDKLSLDALRALHAVLTYVDEVSFGNTPRLSQFSCDEPSRAVLIDSATRRNLELTETRIDGDKKNSLLSHVDYAKTAMGSRLLGEWLLAPSASREEIECKHAAVEELLERRDERIGFREALMSVRDIDRLVSRITGFRATPRDMGALRDSLSVFPRLQELFAVLRSDLLKDLASQFDALDDVFTRLESALTSEPPLRLNEGGIFRGGYHPEVDRLRQIGSDGSAWLVDLEQRERKRTGITSLKVKFNNVFGYFIEITKAHLDKIPADYERRQTLVNAERFVIPELKEYEAELLSAKARQYDLERELFVELRGWICEQAGRIQSSARCLATLDGLASFAHLAETHNFKRPVMLDEARMLIVGGRHPVIERVIGFHRFVPNDTRLDGDKRRFAVLTGPNMGGKSTYLRQVGLIQLLAQAGSFVPAERAELGVVDRIFTRIGAADDLARGDSTFMVEMREAAAIVQKATSRSLVLIDEIGRGTATTDGLSLATAIAEWLHDVIGCRTLFATHFHELTELGRDKPGAFCLSVGVVEEGDEISFTHRIEERIADRSYGIEVARLAGLPPALIGRAKELLDGLEKIGEKPVRTSVEPPAVEKMSPRLQKLERAAQRLNQCQLDSMTPLQALVELSEIKDTLR